MGHDVRRDPMAIRRLLGYVPQQLSIEPALTGRENVGWFARLFDVPRRERAARVTDALEAMGLGDAAGRLAGTYSGGMVRRLELGQALVNRPALLILDEPTVGLDPIARDSVWQRVHELREATGMTVLLTTHYMEEADALCDRIALMHEGRIRAEGAPEELKDELGPDATLEDVFRHFTGGTLDGETEGRRGLRDVRSTRRTARRVG
jgi:ABC-2 type transport system ATP-binding protein